MKRLANNSQLTLLLTAALCSSEVHAQSLSPRGNLAGQELGFMTTDHPNVIVRKRPGLPAVLSTYETVSVGTAPNYSFAAIELEMHSEAGGSTPLIEIDSFSSGNDLIPFQGQPVNNRIYVDPRAVGQTLGGWGALFMTFANNGYVGSSQYLSNLPSNQIGSEVIGYYFDGSLLPDQMVGTTFLEQSREQGDFTATPALPVPADMDMTAIDKGMAAVIANQGTPVIGVIPCTQRLYFTLSTASANAVDATPLAANITRPDPQDPITGATIFVALYTNSTLHSVEIWKEYDEAVPPASSQQEEDMRLLANIDALCVGHEQPTTQTTPLTPGGVIPDPKFLVVSYEGPNYGDQIQCIWLANSLPLIEQFARIFDYAGSPIIDLIGFVTGTDVDGMCTEDPEFGAVPATFGAPVYDAITYDRPGFSCHVELTPGIPSHSPTHEQLEIFGTVTGWGTGAAAQSLVLLSITHPTHPFAQTDFFWLPNRAANTAPYNFTQQVLWPVGLSGQSEMVVGLWPLNGDPPMATWKLAVRRP